MTEQVRRAEASSSTTVLSLSPDLANTVSMVFAVAELVGLPVFCIYLAWRAAR